MEQSFEIKEFSIVIVAESHNPSLLNPDFLKTNRIVPSEWKLNRPPICVAAVAEVSFKGGVKITTQPDRVVFIERIDNNDLSEVQIQGISQRYVSTLPHVNYTAVGINFKGHADRTALGDNYITDRIIKSGKWIDSSIGPIETALKFTYQFKGSVCYLSVSNSYFSKPDKSKQPVILFDANFHHRLPNSYDPDKAGVINNIINNWDNCLKNLDQLAGNILNS